MFNPLTLYFSLSVSYFWYSTMSFVLNCSADSTSARSPSSEHFFSAFACSSLALSEEFSSLTMFWRRSYWDKSKERLHLRSGSKLGCLNSHPATGGGEVHPTSRFSRALYFKHNMHALWQAGMYRDTVSVDTGSRPFFVSVSVSKTQFQAY